MKANYLRFLQVFSAGALAAHCTVHADLKHRYSFGGEAASIVATDSAGTAHGTLLGGATLSGTGSVALDGGSGYVDLPNGIISSLTNATIEMWITWNGGAIWQRIFDFGTSTAGEDMQGNGLEFMFLTPQSGLGGNPMIFGKVGEPDLAVPTLATGQEVHVVVVYSPSGNFSRLYVDGELMATGGAGTPLSAVNDLNNWLGRSQFIADAYLNASITEFRIWDTALSTIEVALNRQAGPDQLGGSDPGPVQTLTLTVQPSMFRGNTQQATATATFGTIGDIGLANDPEAVFSSTDTNILAVSPSGLVRAVNEGTASVRVSYRGSQDAEPITVLQSPSLTPVLKHRYNFSLEPSATTATDSVGGAHGTLAGGAVLDFDGNVVLNGTSSYVDLPNRIISRLTNASFEAWTTWNGGSLWQRLFDFGTSTGGEGQQGTGQNFFFLTAAGGGGGGTMRVGVAGQADLIAPAPLPTGMANHVAVTYNVADNISRLYLNARLVASGTASIPLRNINDLNNWLGRSQFIADAYFGGSLAEFRIYEGILTAETVAFNAVAGPEVTNANPGSLESISLSVPSENLVLGVPPTNATVRATFENLENVDITGFSGVVFESSNPGVVTVANNGVLDAAGEGTATVSVRYQGRQASVVMTVNLPPDYSPPTLVHRYSFSEAPGSTAVSDSVGNQHGMLVGSGVFSGAGRLALNGGNAYVNLPNGLVSSLSTVTFEAWVIWTSQRYWERIFDFGTSTGGEGNQGTGQAFIFLAPRGGPNPGALFFGVAGQADLLGPSLLPTNRLVHVAVSYNVLVGSTRLYVDGRRVAIGPASIGLSGIQDLNVWLGRSNFPDPNFTGSFDEFRIYSGALLDAAVAASYAAGPDVLPARLNVRLSGATVILTWPAYATGYQLETASTLGAGAQWSAINAMPEVADGQFRVTLPVGGTAAFFRLRR